MHLAKIEIMLGEEPQSAFAYTMVTINLVIVVKKFSLIYKVLLITLLVDGKQERGLLGPVLDYSATVKTNRRGIL